VRSDMLELAAIERAALMTVGDKRDDICVVRRSLPHTISVPAFRQQKEPTTPSSKSAILRVRRPPLADRDLREGQDVHPRAALAAAFGRWRHVRCERMR
jgi:hypothetical protein